jgi:hypothetical protein
MGSARLVDHTIDYLEWRVVVVEKRIGVLEGGIFF